LNDEVLLRHRHLDFDGLGIDRGAPDEQEESTDSEDPEDHHVPSSHAKCGREDTVVAALVSMADLYQWRVFPGVIPE